MNPLPSVTNYAAVSAARTAVSLDRRASPIPGRVDGRPGGWVLVFGSRDPSDGSPGGWVFVFRSRDTWDGWPGGWAIVSRSLDTPDE